MASKKSAKKRKKRLLQKRYILLTAIVAYIVYAFGSEYLTLRDLNQQYAQLAAEKQGLLAEQKQLLAKHNYMLSNAFVELTARKELGFVKPGEHVIVPAKPTNVPLQEKSIAPEQIH